MSAIFYQQYLKTIDRNVKIAYKEFTRLLDYTIIDNEEVSLLVEELMYVEENKISSIIKNRVDSYLFLLNRKLKFKNICIL